MKRKLVSILSTIVPTITLGPLFILSWLLGLLASSYVAGDATGKQGKVRLIIVPFRKWGIHLHHWVYSLCLISLSLVTGIHFLSPTVTYGVLGGITFQGVYYYSDWHVVLIRKQRTTVKDHGA